MSTRFFGAALLAIAASVPANAEQIAGLTNDGRIVTFDSATPGTITSNFAVSGLTMGDQLIGIDRRPANSLIYGVAQTGRIYTLTTSGVAALVATAATLPAGSTFGIDFNPMADRLRVISEADQNLNVNVGDGVVLAQTGITRAGGAIDIVGSAYSNNFAGTGSTTLYGIDSVSDTLVSTAAPGGGVYTNVGALGFNVTNTSNLGFDISGRTGMAYFNIDNLFYSLSLTPSSVDAATFIGTIGSGPLIGLTATAGAVPEPSSWLMMIAGFGIIGRGMRFRTARHLKLA
jgi:Domain of unknown function (DUF4394)/PEP-CTERM motif